MKKEAETKEKRKERLLQLDHLTVLSCIGSGFIPRLIKWFTKGKFSHTAILFHYGNEVLILDAQKGGFEFKTVDKWIQVYNYQFVALKCPYGSLRKHSISQKAMLLIGKEYDFTSFLFRFPRQKLIRFFNKFRRYKKVEQPAITEESMIKKLYCSEVVSHLYGFPIPIISPSELHHLLMKNGFELC